MRIRRKFLQLTNYTYPYGFESFLKSYLPKGSIKDEHGNYFLVIGEKPTTMFTCHLDTACIKQEKVKHIQVENIIKTDGKTILGADDKAGMTVILYMIEKKIPGLYYFFIGEEVGCIGSGKLSDNWSNFEYSQSIKKCVSFDRRGTKSIITNQFYGTCCSDEFGQDLADKLNATGNGLSMELDDTGIMTDSAKFMHLIPECTNISVGYYNEHTKSEYQNIDFLSRLCKAVTMIDWESLAVVRDPDLDFDDEDDDFDFPTTEQFNSENYSYFKMKIGEPARKMYISTKQIEKERGAISDWIFNQSSYFDVRKFHWNGHKLQIENSVGLLDFVGYRYDIFPFISELESVELDQLSDTPNKSKSKKVINF